MDQEPEKKSRKRLSPAERMSLPSLEMRVSSRAKELEDRAWQMELSLNFGDGLAGQAAAVMG
jgi:hypothetical protein